MKRHYIGSLDQYYPGEGREPQRVPRPMLASPRTLPAEAVPPPRERGMEPLEAIKRQQSPQSRAKRTLSFSPTAFGRFVSRSGAVPFARIAVSVCIVDRSSRQGQGWCQRQPFVPRGIYHVPLPSESQIGRGTKVLICRIRSWEDLRV